MTTLTKILCKVCQTEFLPKSQKNIFCSRKCFKKDFYHRKKAEELASIKFPTFLCPSCDEEITLEFDPLKNEVAWTSFLCPFCSTLMINVSEQIKTQDAPLS